MILDPGVVFEILAALPVGAVVPSEIYISDYANGGRPAWTVVGREPLGDVGHCLTLEDPGNGDMFDRPTIVVLTFPRKTLRTPPQMAGLSGPPVVTGKLCDLLQQARYQQKHS